MAEQATLMSSSQSSADSESVTLADHHSDYSDATLPPLPPTPSLNKDGTGPMLLAAHSTPLPPPTLGEEASLNAHASPMMKEELEEGLFHKSPLEVDHGVAVSEENVGLGLPDIITQI